MFRVEIELGTTEKEGLGELYDNASLRKAMVLAEIDLDARYPDLLELSSRDGSTAEFAYYLANGNWRDNCSLTENQRRWLEVECWRCVNYHVYRLVDAKGGYFPRDYDLERYARVAGWSDRLPTQPGDPEVLQLVKEKRLNPASCMYAWLKNMDELEGFVVHGRLPAWHPGEFIAWKDDERGTAAFADALVYLVKRGIVRVPPYRHWQFLADFCNWAGECATEVLCWHGTSRANSLVESFGLERNVHQLEVVRLQQLASFSYKACRRLGELGVPLDNPDSPHAYAWLPGLLSCVTSSDFWTDVRRAQSTSNPLIVLALLERHRGESTRDPDNAFGQAPSFAEAVGEVVLRKFLPAAGGPPPDEGDIHAVIKAITPSCHMGQRLLEGKGRQKLLE